MQNLLLRAVGIVCMPLLVCANEPDLFLENEMKWSEEETFVVSASRVKESVKKTTASVTVIDSKMIHTVGAANLSEVLNTVAGIGVTQSSINFKEVEVRGIKDFSSKHILFMIDGHSIDATLLNGGGVFVLDSISLENIQRIEIIKGPASALYGANAFVALINIITKSASDINGVIVKTKVSSYNTKEVDFLFGQNYDGLEVVSNINILKSDGNSVHVKKDRAGNSGDTNPIRDDIKADLQLKYKNFYLNTMLVQKDRGSAYGPLGEISNDNNPTIKYQFMEFGYKNTILKNLDLSTRVYYDEYSFDNTWHLLTIPADLKMINALKNEKTGLESLLTYRMNEKFISVFGLLYEDHKQSDVVTIINGANLSNTANTFAPDIQRSMWAGYINNIYDVSEDVRMTIGLRYDNYSDFQANTALRGGVSWNLNDDNTLKLMYGEGFRIPTFAESYNISPVIQGNTDLTPEKVTTYEVSLESAISKKLTTKFTYFHNTFTDLIVQRADLSYINRGKTKTQGVEVDGKYTLQRGSYFMFNYAYIQAKDELTNQELANIAKHSGNLFLNYKVNKYLNVFSHLLYKGATKRVDGDTRDLVNAYSLLNTSFIIKNFYTDFEVQLNINNIFDVTTFDPSNQNATIDDYERNRRNFMLSATYKF